LTIATVAREEPPPLPLPLTPPWGRTYLPPSLLPLRRGRDLPPLPREGRLGAPPKPPNPI